MNDPSQTGPEPDPGMSTAIEVLRHDVLAAGRNLPWDDIRAKIKGLVKWGAPTPAQRLKLLHLYDVVAGKVERRDAHDPFAARRLGYQRANDTMTFLMAEIRDNGDALNLEALAAIVARELAAGRMRMDEPFQELLAWMLREIDDRGGHRTPGVAEPAATFAFPAALSRRPPSPPFHASP